MQNKQFPLLDDLRRLIAQRQVVAVVGAGVSMATTDNAEAASWPGLLRTGVAWVETVVQGLPNRWADRQREAIASGDLDDLLGVAEQVARRLGAPRGGEFRRWLRETVGQLAPVDRTVMDALVALGTPLCTTNYDGLLESVSGLDPVTWRDPARCERVLRGDERAVVHLHGHYREPESIVLGIRSYEDVLGHEPAQALVRALRTYRTLLFVGYGGGLADPNFNAFLDWCARVFPESEYRHYRLARDQEVISLAAEHSAGQRLFVLGYGPEHADLAEFLRGLLPGSVADSSATAPLAAPSGLRERALADAVAAYRAYIARSPRIQRARFADVASRAEDRDRPPAFDRLPLFVLPRLELRPDPRRAQAAERRQNLSELAAESNDRMLLQVLTQPERLCVFIGGPGTGKTELGLWLLAKQCTPGQALPELAADCVPVRLELRQFDHDVQRGGPTYDFFTHLEQSLRAVSVQLDAQQLRELHSAGRLLWIFDGMDEVRTPERRRHYAEMIRTLVGDAPSRAIVTSRAVGCEELIEALGTPAVYSLRDFDDRQIDAFLRNWYALEFVDEPEISERRRQRLALAIEQSRPVRDLCRNPLLLTLLALLNRGDALPRRRHRVFERALDLMVGQWDANKDLPANPRASAVFEREDKLQFLLELAWAMHNNHWPDSQNNLIQRDDLVLFTTEFVSKQFNADEARAKARARALVENLEYRNQTLIYLGNDQYGFVHKSFLEYLAAEALIRVLSPAEQIERFQRDAGDQNSWEVLTLAYGLLDDQAQTLQILRILQAILRRIEYTFQDWYPRFAHYAFAIRCLAEVRKVQEEPMRSLSLGLMQLFQQDALAMVRLRGFWVLPNVIFEALRYLGPHWPAPDTWLPKARVVVGAIQLEEEEALSPDASDLEVVRFAKTPERRYVGIHAFRRIVARDPARRRSMLEIARNPDHEVRLVAALLLWNSAETSEQREDALTLLDELVRQSSNEEVRLEAAQQLGLYPVLLQLAEEAKDEKIRRRAADTLTWLDIRADILRLGLSHQRSGRVDLAGQAVGKIEETEQGSRFLYDADWLRRRDAQPISLTLPLRPEPYESVGLHPFFENLLPEGAYLDLVAKKTNVARSDKFGLLLATCGDCAGAVEVHPWPGS